MNGNIFGEMAVLIQIITKKSNEYTRTIDSANTAMQKIMLPKDLTLEIRNYLIHTQSKMD